MSIFKKVKDKIIRKEEGTKEEVKVESKEKETNKEAKKQKTEEAVEKIEEKPAEKTEKPAKKRAPKVKVVDEAAKAKAATAMGKMLTESKNPPSEGDIVEGLVINIDKSAVYVDLAPFGTGSYSAKNSSLRATSSRT